MRISLIVFLFRFLPNLTPYLKIGCGFVYLLILQLLPDVYETFFFFGMLSWSAGVLLDRHKKKRASWGLIVLGVAFIVTCSLVKFTLLIAGVFCLTVVAGFLLLHKRNIEAAVILGGYPVGFFAFWSLLGQRVGDIPDFLYGSYQVAKGYAMSMQLATGPQAFTFFLLFLMSSVAPIALVLSDQLRGKIKSSRFKQPWLPLVVIQCGFLFMVWKQGVVRSDGHIWQFFCYVPLAAWFLYPVVRKKASQMMYGSLLVINLLLMVVAVGSYYPGFIVEVPERLWTNTRDGLHGLLKPSGSMNALNSELEGKGASLLENNPLLTRVGERTVDMVGDHQGLVILPRLDYQPRPVFQNYVANNPYLQDLNRDYWEAGKTPDAVVQRLDAIDGTLSTQADSQTILHLLSHYSLEVDEGNSVLLAKRSIAATVELSSPKEYPLRFEEPVDLDSTESGFLLARLQLPLNLLGRLRAFLYKPPLLKMRAGLEDGSYREFRINPVTVQRDFLFAPAIENASELWSYRSGKKLPEVVNFTLHTESGEAIYFSKKLFLTTTSFQWLEPE
jgi:hypothetical protein